MTQERRMEAHFGVWDQAFILLVLSKVQELSRKPKRLFSLTFKANLFILVFPYMPINTTPLQFYWTNNLFKIQIGKHLFMAFMQGPEMETDKTIQDPYQCPFQRLDNQRSPLLGFLGHLEITVLYFSHNIKCICKYIWNTSIKATLKMSFKILI